MDMAKLWLMTTSYENKFKKNRRLKLEMNMNFNYWQSVHVWIIDDDNNWLICLMTSVCMYRVIDILWYGGVMARIYGGVCGEIWTISIHDWQRVCPNSIHPSILRGQEVCLNSICLLKWMGDLYITKYVK